MGQNFSSEPVVDKDTERDSNDLFNIAVSSCQGWRLSQEDNHSLILDLPGNHKAAFFAVFDGHGSAKVSKHASEDLWRHLVENELYIKGNFKEALRESFLSFDREVSDSYNAQLAGTTAVCLLIVENTVYCANIGDSRGVACVNCECVPLSYDHKPENPTELKRILEAGGYVLGNRVNGNLALSRAFGDFHYKGNEQLPPEQQIVSPCPDIKSIALNDDLDFLLLACDGIWDVLKSEEAVDFVISRLEQNMEPGLICEQLTTRCLATDYELVIGCDNMTVLLVCYTRNRSWQDYCNDIFNKNTKRLGQTRIKPPPTASTTSSSSSSSSPAGSSGDKSPIGDERPEGAVALATAQRSDTLKQRQEVPASDLNGDEGAQASVDVAANEKQVEDTSEIIISHSEVEVGGADPELSGSSKTTEVTSDNKIENSSANSSCVEQKSPQTSSETNRNDKENDDDCGDEKVVDPKQEIKAEN